MHNRSFSGDLVMLDAASSGHPLHLSGINTAGISFRIKMIEAALQHVRNCLEATVRVYIKDTLGKPVLR
ncbi:hypothetical protein BKG84_06675 [Mycobacteroides chelonae]|uniref:Uncharacterized protein n=1 Tax=Mycobacteroides chelonae TaxID=1774 RepID=A0A1S1LZ95_MYCCH|nr:hypothetical protein BKG84_06675 [Mycobacteroides chelonae]